MQVVVIIVWLAAVTIGVIGAARIEVDGDVNNFIPSGSYLNTYLDLGGGSIGDGTPVELYFVNTPEASVDFSQPEIHEQMLAAIDALNSAEFTREGSFDAVSYTHLTLPTKA